MLPKSERLTKEDFKLLCSRVVFRGELFDLATTTIPLQKFACVISKKTLKKAVERNKVKRRIFSCLDSAMCNKQYSVIVYPKKQSKDIPYSQLEEEIQKAFATLQ